MRRCRGESTSGRLIGAPGRQLIVGPRTRSAASGLRLDRRNPAIPRASPPARTLHIALSINRKDMTMNTIDTLDNVSLDNVTGGAVIRSSATSDAVAQSLTSLQTTVSQMANNNNNQSSNLLLPMAMMAMMNRRQSTVVSPGGTIIG
jgi:hypothetical protein